MENYPKIIIKYQPNLWPGMVARLDAYPPGMQVVVGSILTSGNILLGRLVMK